MVLDDDRVQVAPAPVGPRDQVGSSIARAGPTAPRRVWARRRAHAILLRRRQTLEGGPHRIALVARGRPATVHRVLRGLRVPGFAISTG